MFRLIRGLIALLLLSVLIYLAITVPLGEQTLWQHLRAIAKTDESRQLVKGVKQKADEVIREHFEDDASPSGEAREEPQDAPTGGEKRQLRRLLRRKLEADDAAKASGRD